jgi:hypothetical protein
MSHQEKEKKHREKRKDEGAESGSQKQARTDSTPGKKDKAKKHDKSPSSTTNAENHKEKAKDSLGKELDREKQSETPKKRPLSAQESSESSKKSPSEIKDKVVKKMPGSLFIFTADLSSSAAFYYHFPVPIPAASSPREREPRKTIMLEDSDDEGRLRSVSVLLFCLILSDIPQPDAAGDEEEEELWSDPEEAELVRSWDSKAENQRVCRFSKQESETLRQAIEKYIKVSTCICLLLHYPSMSAIEYQHGAHQITNEKRTHRAAAETFPVFDSEKSNAGTQPEDRGSIQRENEEPRAQGCLEADWCVLPSHARLCTPPLLSPFLIVSAYAFAFIPYLLDL